MRYALKFAYDGTKFEGYARQPKMITIEGEIIRALKAKSIAQDLQSASRTDRGVSAAGNVIVIETDFALKGIIPALNSELEGIHFHGIAKVPEDFNPRHAEQRWYRYVFLKGHCPPVRELGKASKLFLGEHDFRLLSKKDTGHEKTVLAIDSITFTETGEFVYADIKAQRFLWEMVRRMLSVIVSVAEEKTDAVTVEKLLTGESALKGGIKPLPPENLVLMDVVYDLEFRSVVTGHSYFADEVKSLRGRAEVISLVAEALRGPE
ncbi:MAG: tRNA pseudouridine(38-40) synthase TruA [Thermoplasmata archaeon]|nr:tRNA pseudouridine(38-40) synthase TruA [Thermoplasmata archaeon]